MPVITKIIVAIFHDNIYSVNMHCIFLFVHSYSAVRLAEVGFSLVMPEVRNASLVHFSRSFIRKQTSLFHLASPRLVKTV